MDELTQVNDVPSYMAYDCEKCGAPAGEPCPDSCPYSEAADVLADADEAQADMPGLSPVQCRGAICALLTKLPFANLLDDAPDPTDQSEDVWLERTAIWLYRYQELAAAQVEMLQADRLKAIGTQIEFDILRKVVRDVVREEAGERYGSD